MIRADGRRPPPAPGWPPAESGMPPPPPPPRPPRETGRVSGRTHEIQRLIGRSLRSVAQMDLLGERTFTLDCDVIKADGGTRSDTSTSYASHPFCLLTKRGGGVDCD